MPYMEDRDGWAGAGQAALTLMDDSGYNARARPWRAAWVV